MKSILCIGLAAAILFGGVSTAQAQRLPKLEKPKCHLLYGHHLKGKKLWQHWIWHLRRSEYNRICATIAGESGWDPDVVNSLGYTGLLQWGRAWQNGTYWKWSFDATDPVLSIRMMDYNLDHADKYGGWSNWAGH